MNSIEHKLLLRKIFNLVYVPEEKIFEEYFKTRKKIESLNGDFTEFFKYFESNYLGTLEKEGRFIKSFWSCQKRVLKEITRTTNSLEGWHRNLNFKCNIPHLNLGKFIEKLLMEVERIRLENSSLKKIVYSKK